MTPGRKCDCKNGKVLGYGCPGFKLIELPCERCEGTGWLTPDRDEVLEAGAKLAQARRGLKLSLREAGPLVSMSAPDLSYLEFGQHGATAKRINDVRALLIQRAKERPVGE